MYSKDSENKGTSLVMDVINVVNAIDSSGKTDQIFSLIETLINHIKKLIPTQSPLFDIPTGEVNKKLKNWVSQWIPQKSLIPFDSNLSVNTLEDMEILMKIILNNIAENIQSSVTEWNCTEILWEVGQNLRDNQYQLIQKNDEYKEWSDKRILLMDIINIIKLIYEYEKNANYQILSSTEILMNHVFQHILKVKNSTQ